MTPLGIEILLHYYTTPGDFRDGDWSEAPAVKEIIEDYFIRDGLLRKVGGDDRGRKYELAQRGVAYVEALKAMPLPECKWGIPNGDWLTDWSAP